MAELPESVRLKIKRAYEQIAYLKVANEAFVNSRPYTVLGEIDSDGRPTYSISDLKPVRPEISLVAGETIQSLRTALDYLACALWSQTNAGDCKIYFPIAKNFTEYKSEALRKVKGLRQGVIDAICLIEPYGGGKGEILWHLHHLSIIDKHRLPLALTGGNLGIHLPSVYPERFTESERRNPWIISMQGFEIPLKTNKVIFRDEAGRELKQDFQFPVFVVLNEVGVIPCQPLLPFLKDMADAVKHLIDGFIPFFA